MESNVEILDQLKPQAIEESLSPGAEELSALRREGPETIMAAAQPHYGSSISRDNSKNHLQSEVVKIS